MNNMKESSVVSNDQIEDSRRIDALVVDVGAIKGEVTIVRDGVDKLNSAMERLIRHDMRLDQSAAEHVEIHKVAADHEIRISAIETVMPGLQESRADMRKLMMAIISAVALAVVALVLGIKR